MPHRVTLIPGDGIGPEVADAARTVVEATGVGVAWDVQDAGATVIDAEGTPLPDRVLDSIRQTGVAIKGPITTPVGTGFRSVNVALRQELDLFAAVRPSRHLPGVETRHPGVDLVVVRENTEDLYQGIEFERGSDATAGLRRRLSDLAGYRIPDDAGVTVKPISVSGTRRIVRFGLEYALRHGRKKVTVGHKANIMKFSDGVFLQTALGIAAAEYPEVIDVEAIQVDELAMWLAWHPEDLDVLLLPNLYGDIISDLCAGLVGGLGLAPGANIGNRYAVFEPVHGSAPDIAGKGIANPVAMILTAALMLRHLGEDDGGAAVESAVAAVLEEGRVVTPDMGGSASTADVAAAVAARLA
ncbi:MAG TPA: isocitrate/isopropylmalate dehydrogenase family protein [Actinomycetota bacterium]|nr:isocitrate/isopropylmalate dehydrogenase family protein [Actinomycetota bacterium]